MNNSVTRPALGVGAMASLIAVLVLVLILLSGATESRPAEAHGWPTDGGCSPYPSAMNSGPYWNFHNACDNHDRCFVLHSDTYWGCNWKFRSEMRSSCYGAYQWWQWQRPACLALADVYYAGVTAFGWPCYVGFLPSCRVS